MFNGPRAGINFNDGFGGGTNVTNNVRRNTQFLALLFKLACGTDGLTLRCLQLIYNQCRESGDCATTAFCASSFRRVSHCARSFLCPPFADEAHCGAGDHGAMNAWDRTAYISDVKYGAPSYEAQMNSVDHNFIIANVRVFWNQQAACVPPPQAIGPLFVPRFRCRFS